MEINNNVNPNEENTAEKVSGERKSPPASRPVPPSGTRQIPTGSNPAPSAQNSAARPIQRRVAPQGQGVPAANRPSGGQRPIGGSAKNPPQRPAPHENGGARIAHPASDVNGEAKVVHSAPDANGEVRTASVRRPVVPANGNARAAHPTPDTNGEAKVAHPGPDSNGDVRAMPTRRPVAPSNGEARAAQPVPHTNSEAKSTPVRRPAAPTNGEPKVAHPAPHVNGEAKAAHPAPHVNGEPKAAHPAPHVNGEAKAAHPAPDANGEAQSIPSQRPVSPANDEAKTARQTPMASGEEGENALQNNRPTNLTASAEEIQSAPEENGITPAAVEHSVSNPVPDKGRPSVLRPMAEDTTGTRVIPAQSRGKKQAEAKKKKKNSALRERLREEGNNAVLSLVKAAIYLVCVLLISTIISVTVIMVGNDIYAFVKADTEISVVIPEDADIPEIADILASNGIIKYPSVFTAYAEDKDQGYGKYAGVFVAGTYELRPSMDYEDLLAALKPKTPAGTSWVTIPEGFTTDEIIDLLIEKGIGSIDVDEKDKNYSYYSQFTDLRDAYEDVINNYDFSYWFVEELEEEGVSGDRIYRLDGYLFPDTYEFYNASKPHAVINKFLARFSQIFTEEYRALVEQSQYTVDDIVILASMVEKEAANAADYFNVSEVFRNRLENPAVQNTYTLDSDATVLYYIHHTTGERPTKTTPEDTAMDVPYNTYKNQGLPPGPISNPSATALLAAMNPSTEGYYFFVTGNKDTYFTSNIYDHNYFVSLIANGME